MPVLILFLALGVRLYGIDWDQGALYHPAIKVRARPSSSRLANWSFLLSPNLIRSWTPKKAP